MGVTRWLWLDLGLRAVDSEAGGSEKGLGWGEDGFRRLVVRPGALLGLEQVLWGSEAGGSGRFGAGALGVAICGFAAEGSYRFAADPNNVKTCRFWFPMKKDPDRVAPLGLPAGPVSRSPQWRGGESSGGWRPGWVRGGPLGGNSGLGRYQEIFGVIWRSGVYLGCRWITA